MTGINLIKRAYRLVGQLRAGRSPSTAETDDGLTALNAMLDGFNADGLMIFGLARDVYTITSGQQAYTLGGPAGAYRWSATRPSRIERAGVIQTSTVPTLELPLHLYTADEWAEVRIKAVTSSLPMGIYPEPTTALWTLYVWPSPTSGALQAAIYSWRTLTAFADTTTDHSFPPGYEEMLAYQLAVRMAPELSRGKLLPEVYQRAKEALATVRLANFRPIQTTPDPGCTGDSSRGGFNWRTGS